MVANFPFIRIAGDPSARGRQYGEGAADRIGASLLLYRKLFSAYASMTWEQAIKKAKGFEPFIGQYLPDAIGEMRGIAEGSGFTYEDILALNCRSELMFAPPDGCTSAIVPPEAAADKKTYIAQTWDWLRPAQDACVVVELHQRPLPSLIMACEAGLIGGKGVNAAGIGCGMNALGIGWGKLGTPLHLIYRGIMNSVKISDSIEAVSKTERAGCANFIIGSAEGMALNLEFTPENFDVSFAEHAPLAHGNHFLSPILAPEDKLKAQFPCSFPRYHRAKMLLEERRGRLTRESLFEIMADHVNYPDSVCSHEDERDAEWSRYCTIFGFLADLAEREIWIAPGNPCESEWRSYRLASEA
ncbi:MAG: C45 family peptidase [Planctomycetota bacterium]|jgi:isopenicillin-N N-acyltransferase-like protein|nr:C45 family peptidase [Planctomycetota bacterium]